MHRSKKRVFLALGAVALIAVAGSAYTNTNTFAAEPKAGAGSQSVSGYDVSNVHYDLNASDPQNIDSIDFDLDGVPASSATIKYRLSDTGGWSGNCAFVAGASTSTVDDCAAPGGSTVAGVTNLTVVVAD